MKSRLVVAAVAALWAGGASASDWYVRGDAAYGWGGNTEIQDKDCNSGNAMGCGTTVDGDFGNGTGFGLGAGYQLKPWLRTEATVTYRGGYEFSGRSEALALDVKQELEAWTGMLNAYVDVRGLTKARMGVFHPFVGAGIGVSHNKLGTLKLTNGGQTGNASGGDSTDFAWSLTAGTGIMVVKDKLMFDVAYRYTDLGSSENKADALQSVDATEAGIQLHEITAGLRYMF